MRAQPPGPEEGGQCGRGQSERVSGRRWGSERSLQQLMLRPLHRPAAVLGMSEPGSGGSRMWRAEGTREEAVAVGSD